MVEKRAPWGRWVRRSGVDGTEATPRPSRRPRPSPHRRPARSPTTTPTRGGPGTANPPGPTPDSTRSWARRPRTRSERPSSARSAGLNPRPNHTGRSPTTTPPTASSRTVNNDSVDPGAFDPDDPYVVARGAGLGELGADRVGSPSTRQAAPPRSAPRRLGRGSGAERESHGRDQPRLRRTPQAPHRLTRALSNRPDRSSRRRRRSSARGSSTRRPTNVSRPSYTTTA